MHVYRYLAEPCSLADAEALRRQLRLAGDYRRMLARIENGERAAVSALYREDPQIVALEDAVAACVAATGTSMVPDRTLPPALDAIYKALSAARKARAATSEHREKLSAIRERRGPMVRSARSHATAAGLFWGTYLTVEDAHDRACRDRAPWEPLIVHGSWNTVAVQIQSTKPLLGSDMLGGSDTRARIGDHLYALGPRVDYFPTEAVGEVCNRSGAVRPQTYRRLQIRTGSDGRAPIWTSLHVLMAGGGRKGRGGDRSPRTLPNASIAWVRVHREIVGFTPGGPRERWEVQIIARDEEQRTTPTGRGIVGIDIGWRRVEGGIRVAYASSPKGYDELVIPDDVIDRKDKSSDLRSIRDKHRDVVQRDLCAWRLEPESPTWFVEATQHTHVWRRIGRYVVLTRVMSERGLWPERVEQLEAWLKQDRHLLAWERNGVRRMGLEVLGRQRAWVDRVLRGCHVVGVEQTIRIDKMRGRPTSDDEAMRQAAVAHTEVSPGALRLLVIQMAKSRGIRVVEVDPATTTSTDPISGRVRNVDQRPLELPCDDGSMEDQDHTAAREIALRASTIVHAPVGELLAPGVAGGSTTQKPGRRNRKRIVVAPLADVGVTSSDGSGSA